MPTVNFIGPITMITFEKNKAFIEELALWIVFFFSQEMATCSVVQGFQGLVIRSNCSFKVCASFDYQMLSLVSLQIILQLGLHFLAKLPVMYTSLSAWNPKSVACLLCSKFNHNSPGLTKLSSKTFGVFFFVLFFCYSLNSRDLFLNLRRLVKMTKPFWI